MARTEVSAVIRDIIEAFQNGLKLSKGEGRRHKRRPSELTDSDESKPVRTSLTKRPQEIKQAYEQSVMQHGREFEVGDPTSQIALAQILLSFNTGLVKLLNQALSKDSKHRHSPTGSLLNLSESAGLETLSALAELNHRLVSSRLHLPLAKSHDTANNQEKTVNRSRDQSQGQVSKRPPPTPQLKNGGWVRSKSDPSIVSVVVPKKPRSEQRRGSVSRSPTSPPLKTATLITSPKKQGRESVSDARTSGQDSPPIVKPKPKHLQSNQKPAAVQERLSPAKELVRHPSMYIVPSDFFNMFPLSEDSDTLPSLTPPKVPLHSRPRPRATLEDQDDYQKRARPTSMMTFMTASTKIGEIPEHLLPDRKLTPEEREQIPMPYVVPEMLNPPRKKAPRHLKFWKKDRAGTATVGSILV